MENQDPLEKIVNELVDASWKEKMAFSEKKKSFLKLM